jgi:hypothetical protein
MMLNVNTGTLEWSFKMEKSICIPSYIEVNDANVNSDKNDINDDDHFYDNNGKEIYHNIENNSKKNMHLLQKNKNKKNDGNDVCFSIQLSIPDFPTFPVFEFKNSWAIEDGIAGIYEYKCEY